MPQGLIDRFEFHRSLKRRAAALGLHLAVLAYVLFQSMVRGGTVGISLATIPLAVGLALLLIPTARLFWNLLRPPAVLAMDGAGLWATRRDGSRWRGPWERVHSQQPTGKAREHSTTIHCGPPPTDPNSLGTWLAVQAKDLDQPLAELWDGLANRDELAPPEDPVPEEPPPPPPSSPPTPPNLTARRRTTDSQTIAAEHPLLIPGYLLAYVSAQTANLGWQKMLLITSITFGCLGLFFVFWRRHRHKARLILDQGGISTIHFPRNWALSWADVLGYGQVFTSQRFEFLVLFHRLDPAPPASGIRQKAGAPRKLIPSFQHAMAAMPQDAFPAGEEPIGWCMVETTDLKGDHAEITTAIRQGLAWGRSLQAQKGEAPA